MMSRSNRQKYEQRNFGISNMGLALALAAAARSCSMNNNCARTDRALCEVAGSDVGA